MKQFTHQKWGAHSSRFICIVTMRLPILFRREVIATNTNGKSNDGATWT
jgi:hypothetical protein